MTSPFPGMDPYLEDPAVWRDFHGELIYACRGVLLDRLPAQYDAAVDEQVRLVEVEEGGDDRVARDVLPDVAVSHGTTGAAGGAGNAGPVVMEPVTIRVPAAQEVRSRWIEIRYRPDRSLVTVVEILSPTNKSSDGHGEYRAKRRALLRQDVNLVELDLLVGGRRLESTGTLPPGDYYALVSRPERPGERDVYAWGARLPLPAIAVPLRPGDGSVTLDLAAAFSIAYDRGRYGRRLRYDAPPAAPLNEADRAWAAGLGRVAAE